jgi:hypothetical protein
MRRKNVVFHTEVFAVSVSSAFVSKKSFFQGEGEENDFLVFGV